MHTRIALITSTIILLLAAVPWIVMSQSSRSLVPLDLQQAPINYEATVTAAQHATREAERKATSFILVRPIDTAPAGDPGATPVPPVSTQASAIRTSVRTQPTARSFSSSESLPTGTAISESSLALPTPTGGWVEMDDVITPDMLSTQITQDIDDESLMSVTVTFIEKGFNAVGLINVSPLMQETIEITGTFVINHENLVAEIKLIRVAAEDCTSEYRRQIESQINTSLYRLLPQRYVQSYTLTDDHIHIHSRMRP